MALASVLNGECEDLSFERSQPFSNGCGAGHSSLGFEATPGDGLSFFVKNALSDTDDGVERKIEFLHGTTTLAFKVSERMNYSVTFSTGHVQTHEYMSTGITFYVANKLFEIRP